MKDTKTLVNAALSGVVALGIGLLANSAQAKPEWKGHEKCAGIAKKGANDCGTSAHSCKNKAEKDGVAAEWIWVPEGTCDRINGGKKVAAAAKK